MVDNWDWFKDINYLSFLRDIGTYYTVNRMLTMDSVKSRLEREQPMSFWNLTICCCRDTILSNSTKIRLPGTNRRFRPMGKHYLRHRTRTPQIRCGTVRFHQSDYHRLCRQKWANQRAMPYGLTKRNFRHMTTTNIFAISETPKWANACVFYGFAD